MKMARKFAIRPWIQNALLSENLESPVPRKVKARVLQVNHEKCPNGPRDAQITDYEKSILAIFSKEAVLECLKDKVDGNVIKSFTDISGAAVVLTDYKVVPVFDRQEFILKVNHFKVVPALPGSTPENVKASKDDKKVKEKLCSLRRKEHGSRWVKQEDLAKLYCNYKPNENTDGLGEQDLLHNIHKAQMEFSLDSHSSDRETDALPNLLDLLHLACPKDALFCKVKSHSQCRKGDTDGELDGQLMPTCSKTFDTTKSAEGISPGLLGQTSDKIFDLSVSESSQISEASNTSGATTCVTVSDILGVTSQTASDKTRSQNLPQTADHERKNQDCSSVLKRIFHRLPLSQTASDERTSQDLPSASEHEASVTHGTTPQVEPQDLPSSFAHEGPYVTIPLSQGPQTPSDKTNSSQDLLCSSRHRRLVLKIPLSLISQTASDETSQDLQCSSGHEAPVTLTIPLPQTLEKEQQRTKRDMELSKFVHDYWTKKAKKSK